MKNNDLLNCYNKIIKIYPIKIGIENLTELSHLDIISQDYNLTLDHNIDMLNGIISNKKIISIITKNNETYNFYDYIKYLNKSINPIINIDKFNFVIHTYNK